jgi:hypothetical protein
MLPIHRLLLVCLLLAALPFLPFLAADAPPASAPLADIAFADGSGTRHSLRTATDLPAVYVFLSTECPVSNRYAGRIVRLEKEFRGRGVHFFAVFPNDTESAEAVRSYAVEREIAFPVVRDKGILAHGFGATVTPEAVLVDRQGALRYRGRIDDNADGTRVTSRDLDIAIRAVLAGTTPTAPRTRAVGCLIHSADTNAVMRAPKATTPYTYARDIAPILQKRCLSCHRAGEIGSIPLDTYERAVAWAQEVKKQTVTGRMPPWHALSHGEFLDDPQLTRPQVAALASWADGGTPRGDPKAVPPTPVFRKGWKLGKPDAVVEMPEEFAVPAEGGDIYRCFVLRNPFNEDRWISGVEYEPGNRAVVHHVSAFLDTTGQARRMVEADKGGGPGYTNPTPGNGPGYWPVAGQLGGWTPGHEPRRLPPGVGILLPKGAEIVLEAHYHPDGKPEKDRSRLALYLAKDEVRKRLHLGDVSNTTFRIPAGNPDYAVEWSAFTPTDMTLLSVNPHMHNLGRSMRATATLPDGTVRTLVSVNDWDFRWQPSYRFKDPVKLPRRTRIDVVARFDNSATNATNPHRPPREVVWGESTDDEMCTLFLAYTADDEDLRTEAVLVPATPQRD